MDASALIWIAALLLVGVGLVGLVLPALPGAPLLFAGLFLMAWLEGFAYVGTGLLLGLAALALLTFAVDFAAGAFGARRYGASRRAVLGAGIGALVGLFFGIPGVLLGPFAGAVLGELSLHNDLQAAGRAGVGASIGLALGVAAKLALGMSMLFIFLVARFL